MCLILAAWHAHPDYPLVLAANRDELYDRPAAPVGWWADRPRLLAGRDLSAGGTWLGVTADGRFAALTNYRDASRAHREGPSRGGLVVDALDGAIPLEQRLAQLQRDAARFNPFNLIFSDGERLAVFESVPSRGAVLGAGVYGLSNHLLDTPWPKVQNAKSQLAAALTRLPDEGPLLELLRDERQADDAQLPRTGLTLEWERLVSSAFVHAGDYVTRCSTIVLIHASRRVRMREWTWDRAGAPAGQVEYEFSARQPGA